MRYHARMDPVQTAHLTLVCLWGGLVLGELLVEATANDDETRAHASRLHFWMDALWEIPLLCGVVATGAYLAWRAWPLTSWHVVKIALAAGALACNAWCVVLVLQRRHATGEALRHLSTRIRWTGVGVPLGLAALYLGFAFFHRAP
ncbi:MAG: hypothetical protein AB2A00_19880 [Myxococcota bacterium]